MKRKSLVNKLMIPILTLSTLLLTNCEVNKNNIVTKDREEIRYEVPGDSLSNKYIVTFRDFYTDNEITKTIVFSVKPYKE